jgi:hypothetical protein
VKDTSDSKDATLEEGNKLDTNPSAPPPVARSRKWLYIGGAVVVTLVIVGVVVGVILGVDDDEDEDNISPTVPTPVPPEVRPTASPTLALAPTVSPGPVVLTNSNIRAAVTTWVENQDLALSLYGNISACNTSAVTDMRNVFLQKTSFNDDIMAWDVSSVTNMSWMFNAASTFNQDSVLSPTRTLQLSARRVNLTRMKVRRSVGVLDPVPVPPLAALRLLGDDSIFMSAPAASSVLITFPDSRGVRETSR